MTPTTMVDEARMSEAPVQDMNECMNEWSLSLFVHHGRRTNQEGG